MKFSSIRRFFCKLTAIFILAIGTLGSFSVSSLAKDTERSENDAPDVIVIMNESFFDPSVLGSFSVNEDYLPFYHSMTEYTGTQSDNLLKGTLHVSDIGGNSSNTEFEFLTGNSMAFLSPRVSPYSSYLHSGSEYLPALFNQAGYKTFALYPYKGSSWNRNLAYSIMQFSESYFQDSFPSSQMIRGYISDKAVYRKALALCEKNDEPVFAFCSTIQNHSGYQKSYSNFVPTITACGSKSASLDQYLSLLKESDQALEYLMDQVSRSDSKTMVVFFGNHQPNDYVIDPIYDTVSADTSSVSRDIRYQVPYFIWANFDLSGYEMEDTSPSLLGNTVLEAAGIKQNEFQNFLSRLKAIVPSISSQGYLDRDGIFHSLPASQALSRNSPEEDLYINLYRNLQAAAQVSAGMEH